MSLKINLRQLETESLFLKGELTVEELEIVGIDELVIPQNPVSYDLEAQKMENGILVTGIVAVTLKLECSRCLKPFMETLEFGDWACLLELEGEEKVEVNNDLIDLTPFIREDILLGFPQRPLCNTECEGLPGNKVGKPKKASGPGKTVKDASSAWSELNKLKFK